MAQLLERSLLPRWVVRRDGVAYDEALREADAALEQVELGDRTTVKPRNLSGGQQQRVAIARAIVHKPKVLVCDEPTSALDHVTGQHIMELLKSITAQNDRALVVVTHDSRIFEYADRIAEMDDGRVVGIQEQVAAAIDARSAH
jgi:putative ABC transport system ATP-binding protein